MMKNRGFTIIESLVAIAVLVTAITGAMYAVQTGISSYGFSKDQIIAFYLAQEGVEQIRNLRDENRLNDRHWLTGIALNSSDPCYYGQTCLVDPPATQTPSRCPSSVCPVLRYDATSGFYGYTSSWDPSSFTRTITIDSVSANEVAVTVVVSWNRGSASTEFIARENLLDW